MNAVCQGENQEGNNRDGQDQEHVGQSLFQSTRPNPPRAEQDLMKVEDPKRNREAEQDYADSCESEVQSEVIIHDGQAGGGVKPNLARAGPAPLSDVLARFSPPHSGVIRTVAHLR